MLKINNGEECVKPFFFCCSLINGPFSLLLHHHIKEIAFARETVEKGPYYAGNAGGSY